MAFIGQANGSTDKAGLGDHSPVGYAQRARFYGGLTDAGRLLFAKGIARWDCIIILSCIQSSTIILLST